MIEDIPDFDELDAMDTEVGTYPTEDPLDSEYHKLIAERKREAEEDNRPERVAYRVGLGHSLGLS